MPKVSVIVPVYGVEKYIERCARSLFEQTLDDIEYLFIDDCTPDHSTEILKKVLEEYPQRKSQVIIHRMEKNSGQAAVRKWGTLNATGEYVIHCDSDDYLDVNMYEILYDTAIEKELDMVVCDYATVTDGVVSSIHCQLPNYKNDIISQMLSGKFPSFMWNKLVKRTFYQVPDIEWPKGNMWEDMAIMTQVIQKVDQVGYIAKALYYYEVRKDSIMRKYDKRSVILKWKQVRDNVDIIFNHIDKTAFKNERILIRSRERNHLTPKMDDNEVWNLYKSQYKGLNMSLLLSNQMSISQFLKAILYSNKYLHKFAFKYFSAYNR